MRILYQNRGKYLNKKRSICSYIRKVVSDATFYFLITVSQRQIIPVCQYRLHYLCIFSEGESKKSTFWFNVVFNHHREIALFVLGEGLRFLEACALMGSSAFVLRGRRDCWNFSQLLVWQSNNSSRKLRSGKYWCWRKLVSCHKSGRLCLHGEKFAFGKTRLELVWVLVGKQDMKWY